MWWPWCLCLLITNKTFLFYSNDLWLSGGCVWDALTKCWTCPNTNKYIRFIKPHALHSLSSCRSVTALSYWPPYTKPRCGSSDPGPGILEYEYNGFCDIQPVTKMGCEKMVSLDFRISSWHLVFFCILFHNMGLMAAQTCQLVTESEALTFDKVGSSQNISVVRRHSDALDPLYNMQRMFLNAVQPNPFPKGRRNGVKYFKRRAKKKKKSLIYIVV